MFRTLAPFGAALMRLIRSFARMHPAVYTFDPLHGNDRPSFQTERSF